MSAPGRSPTVTRRTLVFDLGGVVVHWQPLQLMRDLLPEQAHDEASAKGVAAAVFQGLTPGGDWAEFDRGRVEPAALASRIAERTGYPVQNLHALIAAIPAHITPMPASVALLERARAAGHRLTLLSNMPRPFAAHLELQHTCLAWFEAAVFSGRVGLMKPERAMFEHAHDALALNLEHALFIDDHVANIDAARACGWQALHFENAAQCEAALCRSGWL
jgi:putative hydrolase of the HAD superfamily